jgi:hypothetical protein
MLQKMVAHRIADPLILRLIGKWLNAGYMLDHSCPNYDLKTDAKKG